MRNCCFMTNIKQNYKTKQNREIREIICNKKNISRGAYSKHIVITLNILPIKFFITISFKTDFFALIFKERSDEI